MKEVLVNLNERSYHITIGAELLSSSQFRLCLPQNKKIVVITNITIAALYAKKVISLIENQGLQASLLTLQDGEQYKTLETFNIILSYLLKEGCGRDTVLIALGGGVIGDLVGFSAACYQRGIDFIQVPTTLMAQVDSSVGGKTAVNHPLGKNMIGAFYQPKSVIIDTAFLSTLPAREFIAGLSEVIKYGIIYDAEFFIWLEEHIENLLDLDASALIYAITRCCEIKAKIVGLDEKESGIRALLNLGHTFAHAIELAMGYGEWLHGEAVSVGIAMATKASELHGLLPKEKSDRIVSLLLKAQLPVRTPENMTFDDFYKNMMRDKKVVANELKLVLPKDIGLSIVTGDVSKGTIREAINTFR